MLRKVPVTPSSKDSSPEVVQKKHPGTSPPTDSDNSDAGSVSSNFAKDDIVIPLWSMKYGRISKLLQSGQEREYVTFKGLKDAKYSVCLQYSEKLHLDKEVFQSNLLLTPKDPADLERLTDYFWKTPRIIPSGVYDNEPELRISKIIPKTKLLMFRLYKVKKKLDFNTPKNNSSSLKE